MIDPRLRTQASRSELQAAWRARRSLRIEGFLEDAVAREALAQLRTLPYNVAISDQAELSFQFWRCAWTPEIACDHLLCGLGRCLHGEALAWVADVTGLALAPPADGLVVSTLYEKGSYLELHNDFGRGRAVAYFLGLCPAPWPAELGGHLELVDPATGAVLERRPPGWNTLDLLDVRGAGAWHQVPMLREHLEWRAISGWFYPAAPGGA